MRAEQVGKEAEGLQESERVVVMEEKDLVVVKKDMEF